MMVIKGQVNMRKTCRKSDSESVKRSSGERSGPGAGSFETKLSLSRNSLDGFK